jgi:hypothetical protein
MDYTWECVFMNPDERKIDSRMHSGVLEKKHFMCSSAPDARIWWFSGIHGSNEEQMNGCKIVNRIC